MLQRLVRALVLAVLLATPVQVWAVDSALEGLPFVKKMQLAKAGDAEAKMAVAEAYESGKDTPASAAKAARWYREAALNGNVEAQYRLAVLVAKGAPGLKADKPTSVKLLQAAAKRGHAASQNLLGQMAQNGDGVPADPKAAIDWYRKAADQKLATAQNNLGVMYLKGLGTDRNLDEAFKLFNAAAEGGDGWAMNNLGGMYEMGWGAPKDIGKAKHFYEMAQAKGIAISAQNLQRVSGTTSTIPAATNVDPAKPATP